MDEVTKTEGSTTINQYPNNNGWNGGWGWGAAPYAAAVPAVPAYGYGMPYGGFGGGGMLGDIMRGFGGNINIGRGGNTLATVATVLAAFAVGAPLLRGGGLLGPGGPGGNPHEDFVTQRELALVRENGTLSAENGQLKAQIYTDNKADNIIKTLVEWRQRQELIDTQTAADVAALKQENANLKSTLGSMLGTYINPQTFAPSQAVYAAGMAARSATAGATTTTAAS